MPGGAHQIDTLDPEATTPKLCPRTSHPSAPIASPAEPSAKIFEHRHVQLVKTIDQEPAFSSPSLALP